MQALPVLHSERLWARGTDVRGFPTALATDAVLAVSSGRRLRGRGKAGDAMNPPAQARFGFTCGGFPGYEALPGNALAAALAGSTRSGVPEQVAYRLDFPAWLSTRTGRDRAMMCEVRTPDLWG